MALRDDILKKYGLSSDGKSAPVAAAAPTITQDGSALEAPQTSGQPATPAAPEKSIREQILAKYEDKPAAKPIDPSTITVKPKEASSAIPQNIVDRKETISAAPEQSFMQKIGSGIIKGLQSAGILKSDEDNLAKSQAVSALSRSLDDKPYLEIGKQLGVDKTIKVDLPPGVDESARPYYTDQAVIQAVKDNFDTISKTYQIDKPEPVDPAFVDKHFDDLTKALGIRSVPTDKEVLNGALFAGSLVVGAGEAVVASKLLSATVKAGLGIAGFTALSAAEAKINELVTGNRESFAESISGAANLGPAGEAILQIGDFFAKGAILHGIGKKAPGIAETFTKELVTKYSLPKTVYVEPGKIKDIFQTGTKISPEEMKLVQSLGLDGAGYKEAIKNGVTIEVPTEKIIALADKPYWAKVKSIFNVKSSEQILKTEGGQPKVGPRGLIEAPKAGSESPANAVNEAPVQASPKVQIALKSPVSKSLIDTIQAFTPEDANAFGKKIIQRINDEVGTKITEGQSASLPEGIKVSELPSADGRPAQFNNQGKIEIFLPDLVKDLASLAKGETILAHSDTPAFSKTYKLKDGETMEQLAVRYVEDILMHEKSHEKTMTLEDITKGKQLRQAVVEATATGDQGKITAAKTALDNHMKALETKALEYERTNRENLRSDLFGKKGPSSEVQRGINRNIEGSPKKVVMTESKALEERFKNQATGARAGLAEGKKQGEIAVAETKTKYEQAIETIKDRQATVLQRRTALIDYAEAFLPAAVRGTYLKAIRNTVSEKEFIDTLQRMKDDANLVERKDLMSDIAKELKGTVIKKKGGFPNVKFEVEAQRKLNSIRANINGDYNAAQVKIADTVSDWQTAHPDEVLPESIIGEIQLLKMIGIKDMTPKELRSVLSDIQSIKETGRTLKELERFNRDSEILSAKDKIREIITGGKPLPSTRQSLKQEPRNGVLQNAKEFLTFQQYGLEEVLDALSKFDKSSKPYESFLSKRVSEKAGDAFNRQNSGEIKEVDGVNTELKKIYNLKDNSEILGLINDLQKPVNLGDIIHSDGSIKNLTISRGQAMQMEAWLKDPTLADTFEKGLNWGPEVIDSMRSILTAEDKKMVDAALAFYKKYYESINPVFVKEFGIDLPFNENYSPVSRNVETTLPENVLLAQEMKAYASAKNGNLKGRVRNNIELKPTDLLENLTRHVVKMEHYKAWSEPMFEFRKIFGDKEIRQSIIDFHGKTPLKIMDNFLNDFARDGVHREKIVKAVDQFRANATKALLGLNWKVGAKQLVGVLNYGIEMPIKDFTSGIASFWSSPLEKARFLKNNSPVLQERFGEGFERDIKFAISKGYDKTLAKSKNFSEVMFTIIRNADKFTVYQGSWAAYRSAFMEAKRAGATDAEAKAKGIKSAEDITNRVQESSRLDTLSPLQRAGSWAKLFTMFASQPSKYLRIINNAARNIRYGRGDKATNFKRIAFAWFVVPFVYNLIANKLQKDEYEASTGQVALQSLLGPLTYPLIIGQMMQSIFGWVAGEKFAYTPSAAFSFMDDIQKAITNMTAGDVSEGTTYMIDALGKGTGVPTGIVTKPVRDALHGASDTPQGAVAGF